jgi:hypothetical protein
MGNNVSEEHTASKLTVSACQKIPSYCSLGFFDELFQPTARPVSFALSKRHSIKGVVKI